MKQTGVGRWAGAALVFCTLALGLSTSGPVQRAAAQGAGEGLLELLEQLGTLQQGRSGRGGILSGPATQLERARSRGSPFGAERLVRPQIESTIPGFQPDIPNSFSEVELLLVEDFCRGEISEKNQRLLRVLHKFSRLERDYCSRAQETLLQFGYDLFGGVFEFQELITGAISDNYVLGIGDELIITFHGQESGTNTVIVDSEGRVILGSMAPFAAAGRTFGDFRRELEARTATALLGTDVFVSVGSVRLISVNIVGEVRSPGVHKLTALSSIIDAIGFANGIKKTGSLRLIQVHRGDQIFWLDLYELLLTGTMGQSLRLADGDRIFVPSIGATLALAGDALRPGIYELPEGSNEISIAELLDYAGGALRPRGNIFYHISFDQNGRQRITERPDASARVTKGDIIIIHRRQDVQLGSVELLGHVRVAGRRALGSSPTVRALVTGPELLRPNPYVLFSVLETTDPSTRSRRLFPINLQRVLTNQEDFSLRDGDRLIVLSAEDIRYLSSTDVQDVLLGRPVPGLERAMRSVVGEPTETGGREEQRQALGVEPVQAPGDGNLLQGLLDRGGGTGQVRLQSSAIRLAEETREIEAEVCNGLRVLAAIVSGSRQGRFSNAIRAIDIESELAFTNRLPCPPLYDQFPGLLPFLLEHVAAVNGEVRQPGAYPITANTPLASLVAVAGGLTREVDLAQVELSQFPRDSGQTQGAIQRRKVDMSLAATQAIAIGPGDVIRFNAVFTDRDNGPVLLAGEFLRPGLYQIRRGERLSELIARAGGLTAQAYSYGTVFTRERVKKAQQAGFDRAERELNSALAVVAAQSGADPRGVLALQSLSRKLQSIEALGRVVIEADPTVLQVRPDLDTVLEPGDRLFVPKRPNFVSVTGDVLNPGALQFSAGKNAQDYIEQAGSFQRSADESRVFVVYPNGEAAPVSVSAWNFSPVQIPPGSSIVVPKDPAPLNLLTFAKDITLLVSQIALTAASLAVINSN